MMLLCSKLAATITVCCKGEGLESHLDYQEVCELPHKVKYQRRPRDPEEFRRRLGCQVCLASPTKHAPPCVPHNLGHRCIPVCEQCQARK